MDVLAFGKGLKDWIIIEAPHIKVQNLKFVKIKYDDMSKKWYEQFSFEVKEAYNFKFGH